MSLCSKCSVPVNPVIAIDIDGTIAEYHLSLAQHCWRYWGMQPRYLGEMWDGRGNFEDWIGISQAEYREAKLAYRQGGFKRYATPMPGLQVLRKAIELYREELEVWITTTRPWNRLDSTDPDTKFWLEQHFPVYDHLLYHDNKYSELARILDPRRVIMVVEDLPEMYEEAIVAFGQGVPVMVTRPHNQAWRAERDDCEHGQLHDIASKIGDRIVGYQLMNKICYTR